MSLPEAKDRTDKRPPPEDTRPKAETSGQLDLGAGRGQRRRAPGGLPYAAGDRVGDRYEIEDVVGEGPVGVVYSALDLELEATIAVKVVLSEYFPDGAALETFERQLLPVRDLAHENIVRVFDLERDATRFLITQQLIMGRTLTEVLASRLPQGIASPSDEVRNMLGQLNEALAYAHPDTPHGGLKPSNVLILPAGLQITDFGLVAALPRNAYLAGHRHKRAPMRYLAPEIRAGDPFDARADIYSLAVIGFELLTGMPFPENEAKVALAIKSLPLETQHVLRSALSVDPADRPDHVDDLVEGLLAATETDASGSITAQVAEGTREIDIEDLEEISDDPDAEDGEALLAKPEWKPGAPDLKWYDSSDEDYVKRPAADPWMSGAPPVSEIPPARLREESMPRARVRDGSGVSDPETLIEEAEEVEALPDIDVDQPLPASRRRKPATFGLQATMPGKARARKAQDAIEEMDFEKSLESAIAEAAAAPATRKRRPKRPGDDPDPEAMKNRPIEASGEMAAPSKSNAFVRTITEPEVSVLPQEERREGTAQVPIPEAPPSRLPVWVIILIVAMVAAAATAGVIVVWKRKQQKRDEEAARRRLLALTAARRQSMGVMGPRGVIQPIGDMSSPDAGMRSPGPSYRSFGGPCPLDMVRVHSRRPRQEFCIDRYEFPNRKGREPQRVLNAREGARLCLKLGKRLCSRKEWEHACGGPKGRLFPYGRSFAEGVCVTSGPGGEKREVRPSGSRPGCRSSYGVYDLSGNMAEWVEGSLLMGGSAGKPGRQSSCESDTGGGGSQYYGLRCCRDVRK